MDRGRRPPSQLGTLAAQGSHLLVVAAVTAVYAVIRRTRLSGNLTTTTLTGVALLAAPILFFHAAQSMISSSLSVVIYALLPIAIAVAIGQMRWLLPALASIAGILLLLPVSLPETPRGFLGLALMLLAMAATAAAILFLHKRIVGPWEIVAITFASGLLLSLAGLPEPNWSLQTAEVEALRALLDLPQVLLLFYLIPRIDPRRLSARWLLAPLFTVAEGYAIMHPPLNARLLIGVLLLAAGAIYLLPRARGGLPAASHRLKPV